jgi:hypothetical protein
VRPIAVEDVLAYLTACLGRRDAEGVVEIGSHPLTFKQMMEVYASVRGLRRVIIPVPVLAPGLAARWVGLVTPIPNRLAVPLIEGVVQPLVGDVSRSRHLFPEVVTTGYRAAVESALESVRNHAVDTRWSGASRRPPAYDLSDEEGVFREVRTVRVDAPLADVFQAFAGLGGERGWLVWRWAWGLRGILDGLAGGPGLRRGRRHPHDLHAGEAVDFWRVEAVDPPHALRLRAEMKLPGSAWLQFETRRVGSESELIQTALFAPRGAWGVLYWYGLYPVHRLIFSHLVDAVAREARRQAGTD